MIALIGLGKDKPISEGS